jgi:hypothetical protein
MLVSLLLGCATVFITMSIQVASVVLMVRYLLKTQARDNPKASGFGFDTYVISMTLPMLFFGHLIQIAIWAQLFIYLDEFDDFLTAFYHSTVNFASLGYGDIVMSEKWRLLGALEASNGVLMFGLSAGTILSVMNNLFSRRRPSDPPTPDKAGD